MAYPVIRNPHARIDHSGSAVASSAGNVGLNQDRQPISRARGIVNPFSRSSNPPISRKQKDK